MKPSFKTAAILLMLLPVAHAADSPKTDAPKADPPKTEPEKKEPPKFISPEIAAGRVTVRVYKPNAQSVTLMGQWDGFAKKAMTKNEEGVWSYTTYTVAPNIYEYFMQVDGTDIVDGKNPRIKDTNRSLIEVPGTGPQYYEVKSGPKGVVHEHYYDSRATGTTRRVHIYTPPGYEAGKRKYPVLYLLHGSGDDDSGWSSYFGRANAILDNLIALKQTVPMIVVMPMGHVSIPGKELTGEERYTVFENDLLGDVLPLVEKNYRVAKGRQNRALAGLSMGGGQTLVVGLRHPELFCAYGVFSAGIFEKTPEPFMQAIQTFARSHEPNGALWIGIGKNDFLYPRAQILLTELRAKKIDFTYYEDDSNHSWPTWRDYLHRFTPLLFQHNIPEQK